MEWFETEEIALIVDTVKDISSQEIEGKVVDLESLQKPEFPRAAIATLEDVGLLWGPAPEDTGIGMDDITCVVVLCELAKASAGFAAIVASHYAALRAILALPSGPATVEASYKSGCRLMGVAIERGVEAVDDRGDTTEYIASPSPELVERVVLFSGEDAKMMLAPGAEVSRCSVGRIGLSGCDEMPSARLRVDTSAFEGMDEVATAAVASHSREAMMSALKLYYSAIMQGTARAATEYALGYTHKRRQTGRAIIYHQNVCKKLVEMEVRNQAMASFLYRAACDGDGAGTFGLTDMLFAFVRDESEHVVSEAMQNLGGYGYIREYGIEKKLRDIKALQALLPTSLTDWVAARA